MTKFKKGGYVRCILKSTHNAHADYNQFKLGGVYKIAEVSNKFVTTVEGYRIQTHTGWNYGIEGEWVGMEKPDEFVLPESWYIIVTKENAELVSSWRWPDEPCTWQPCNATLDPGYVTGMYKWADDCIKREHNLDATPKERWGKEITYSQFKEHVLKLKPESKMNQEIIGYKAPMDLFGGNVKKGTLYTPHNDDDTSVGWSPIQYIDGHTRRSLIVPEEIVKQWEPVYKENKTDVVITAGTVTVEKDKITAEGKTLTYDGLKNLKDLFGPQQWPGIPWDVTIKETVKIGCWEVSMGDIATILREYQKLN